MTGLVEGVHVDAHGRTFGGNKAFHNFYNDYSHIADPNLRRRLALSEIDKVPFGLYRVGFFLDSYDIFAINLVTTLLGMVFWSGDESLNGYGGNNGKLPSEINQALKASTSGGIVIGMVVFGWLADYLGRRRMYGIELGIVVFATFAYSLVSSSPSMSASGLLIFWRVIMGIGIGGDYPLSSVITAEFAPTRWRGGMVAAVFSMQGMGQLTAAIVALITTIAFKESFVGVPSEDLCDEGCRAAADRSWRIIVGIGAIPACAALYWRVTIPESPRYTFDVKHDLEKGGADIRAYVSRKAEGKVDAVQQARLKKIAGPSLTVPLASWSNCFDYFREWTNLKVLIGTTMSWFFLDLAFYGLGLNSNIVLRAIGYGDGQTVYHKLYNQAMGMIILACAGSIPGYWTAILTIDTIGRKPLQIFGFLFLTIVFAVLGFMFDALSENAMLALYIIGQFLFNAGPNTTTFIVPGEVFPTRYRATGHGISAGLGKIGAIIAQVISIPVLDKKGGAWLDHLLQLFALFMLLGTLVSFLIPETKGLTLEELSGEARTSYNAGCNGSINLDGDSYNTKSWNPFSGGQPAGFAYPRKHRGSGFTGLRRKRQSKARVGIMTSPVLVAENERQQHSSRSGFWPWTKKSRMSADTTEIALSNRSSAYSAGQGSADGGYEEYPSWGAGWGRIDRGEMSPLGDNSQLQDVGALLQKQ